MADGGDGFDGCIEVVQRTRGYRRWPDEANARIVAESFQPGVRAVDVARRHGLAAHRLSDWRRRARHGKLGLSADALTGVSSDACQPLCRFRWSLRASVGQRMLVGSVVSSPSRSVTILCCRCRGMFRQNGLRRWRAHCEGRRDRRGAAAAGPDRNAAGRLPVWAARRVGKRLGGSFSRRTLWRFSCRLS